MLLFNERNSCVVCFKKIQFKQMLSYPGKYFGIKHGRNNVIINIMQTYKPLHRTLVIPEYRWQHMNKQKY